MTRLLPTRATRPSARQLLLAAVLTVAAVQPASTQDRDVPLDRLANQLAPGRSEETINGVLKLIAGHGEQAAHLSLRVLWYVNEPDTAVQALHTLAAMGPAVDAKAKTLMRDLLQRLGPVPTVNSRTPEDTRRLQILEAAFDAAAHTGATGAVDVALCRNDLRGTGLSRVLASTMAAQPQRYLHHIARLALLRPYHDLNRTALELLILNYPGPPVRADYRGPAVPLVFHAFMGLLAGGIPDVYPEWWYPLLLDMSAADPESYPEPMRRRIEQAVEDASLASVARAFGTLVDRLSSPQVNARQLAARLLTRLGAPAVAPLAAAWQAEPDGRLRLELLHLVSGLGPMARNALLPGLMTMLHGDDRGDQRAAVTALLLIDARQPLLDVLLHWLADGSPSDRGFAIRQLARIGRPAVQPLVELMDANAETADMVAAGLVVLGSDSVPALQSRLGSDDATRRVRAARLLGRIGPAAEPAVERLTALSTDPDSDVAAAACEALARIRKQ